VGIALGEMALISPVLIRPPAGTYLAIIHPAAKRYAWIGFAQKVAGDTPHQNRQR
jgi:hypothetical protein